MMFSTPLFVRLVVRADDGAEPAEPYSVFALDVDGDGDVDVLSASYYSDTVAWYENDGAQSFTERVITTLADGCWSVFAVDVDGDGDVDALSGNWEYGVPVAWYENDGAESFTRRVLDMAEDANENWWQYDFGYSVFAVDVDGDGDVDVLSSYALSNAVIWYENDGAGNFDGHNVYSAAGNADTGDEGFADVQGADLDGDCDVDVVSAAITPDTVWWHEQTCVTPTRRLDDGACDDVMTQWMADNGYTSCAEFALRPKGLDNSCVNNANWVADGSCRQTCYDNGLGYDGDVCGGVAFRIESATDSQFVAVEDASLGATTYLKFCADGSDFNHARRRVRFSRLSPSAR